MDHFERSALNYFSAGDLDRATRLRPRDEWLAERLADVAKLFHGNAAVMEIVTFIRAESPHSICQPTLE
ncbi:MAG: hypothetical protein IH920_03510, partial [Chloroflexi bacterium]|nr:hypothetical protein [Chloroflexota bacterium]